MFKMFLRLTYLTRRCPRQKRFYSKKLENSRSEVKHGEKVTVDLDSSESKLGQDGARKSIDQRLQLLRLRNNFERPGAGLKSSKNRNDLVAEFMDLSKSVIQGGMSVDELGKSNTMLRLEDQLNYYVDIMSNNQVVNLVASLVKMQFDPSSNILRLLEHEIQFRVNSLTLAQVMKLIRFYSSIETSFEQKQLNDILINRLRATLLNDRTTLMEMVEIYRHLAEYNRQTNLLSLTEERMLHLLSGVVNEEDDLITQYLPKVNAYDYSSLCGIFIELASVRRRPTPLLKAASNTLNKTPLPEDEETAPKLSILIDTLSSLVSLNYANRLLVSKLFDDLTDKIKLDDLDLITQCNLLRIIGSLKWRPENLLRLFFDFVIANKENLRKVDHNLILTLLHVSAQLNYKFDGNISDFYRQCMTGSREALIDRRSRKWLNYVWSLAVLNLATDEHLASVLNDDYIRAIENPLALQKNNHVDVMRLLNLRAIAAFEGRSLNLNIKSFDVLYEMKMQRSSEMQKFAAKIRDALVGIVKSGEKLSGEKQTPYGFIVDCGLQLASDGSIEPIDERVLEADLSTLTKSPSAKSEVKTKIALIYVLFDETLTSHLSEPIGHKSIISRILDQIGYRAVFVLEGVLNRFKTSADLSLKLQEIIKGDPVR